jgi:tRNA threonylcarbamoyladenosine modification (KEOPS) complex  Pcc1 subunit
LEADISLAYKSDRQARAVADAVSPDNVKVPEGLTIKTEKQGRNVFTHIRCTSSMLTFTATIDDLLAAVSTAERSISTVKNR